MEGIVVGKRKGECVVCVWGGGKKGEGERNGDTSDCAEEEG